MDQKTDFNMAPVEQIEQLLCAQLAALRLSQNISQAALARQAGVSRRTISRMENGEGVALETFIRVMHALNLTHRLETLLPNPEIRPLERVKMDGRQRRHASSPRSRRSKNQKGKTEALDESLWQWGDTNSKD